MTCTSKEGAGFFPGGSGRELSGVPSQLSLCFPGSLGARLHELKQKVVAENPQQFGVAVPRKRAHVCVLRGGGRGAVCVCLPAHEHFMGM